MDKLIEVAAQDPFMFFALIGMLVFFSHPQKRQKPAPPKTKKQPKRKAGKKLGAKAKVKPKKVKAKSKQQELKAPTLSPEDQAMFDRYYWGRVGAKD